MTNKDKLIEFCKNPPEHKFLIENSAEAYKETCLFNLKEAENDTNNFKGCPHEFGLLMMNRCFHSKSKNRKGAKVKSCTDCWAKALKSS
jgi:hypothetical protein